MSKLEFNLEGSGAVGVFEASEPPCSGGRYRYMPYRSGSHYAMHCRLEAGDIPRCYYDTGATRVFFSVRAFVEYGVLELGDFTAVPRNA